MAEQRKTKVVFVGMKYYPAKGGTDRVIESIIKNLNSAYDISIYCYKGTSDFSELPRLKVFRIPELPLKEIGVFIYYFLCILHLLFFVSRKSVVHIHKIDYAIFIPLIRLKFNTIATSHESPYKRDKWAGLSKFYFKIMEFAFVYSGATLTTISRPLADYYFNRYKKKIIYIPNGISLEIKLNNEKANEILKTNDITDKAFITFSARRIMSTKGLHTMLEAFRRLGYPGHILVAGETEHASNYISLLKKKYADLNVIYLGYLELPELLSLIRMSRLFIFPSEIEGMSMMLLEVVSIGTPVICSDIPENKQIFNENHVLFFKNKSFYDLKEKLEYAFKNTNKMERLARNALNHTVVNYSWDKISASYAKLYGKMTLK